MRPAYVLIEKSEEPVCHPTAMHTNKLQVVNASQPGTPNSIIAEVPPKECERMHSGKAFRFRHWLANHPSMSLTEIQRLTEQMLREKRFDQIFYKTGRSIETGRYCDAQGSKNVSQIVEHLGTAGAWLRITRIDEVTSQFNYIVEQFIADLSELYGKDINSRTMKTFVTLFISSPGAYTNYHMDHTWNFLLQIHGQKTVHLYDPEDVEILPQEDKEEWYMRNFTMTPRAYAKDLAYDLTPGDGVHHPVNAPHWVQNGPEISVSLSIGLCLHESNRVAKIYQANYLLRKLGLQPTPPNRSRWRDRLKVSFVSVWSDRNPQGLDSAVYSGGTRLRRLFRIAPPSNIYDPR